MAVLSLAFSASPQALSALIADWGHQSQPGSRPTPAQDYPNCGLLYAYVLGFQTVWTLSSTPTASLWLAWAVALPGQLRVRQWHGLRFSAAKTAYLAVQ